MLEKFTLIILMSMFATMSSGQTMFGFAEMHCTEMLTRHDSEGKISALEDWLEGYFSGRIRETQRNMAIVVDLNIPIYDLLHKTCSKNPTLSVQEATDLVYVTIP